MLVPHVPCWQILSVSLLVLLQNKSVVEFCPSFDRPVHTVDVHSPPLLTLLTPLPPVSAAVPLRTSEIEASAGLKVLIT